MKHVLVVLVLLVATTATAAPTKQEVEAFAKQMGASFDEVVTTQAQAEAAEKAANHIEAERLWTGVWKGAGMLRDHAKRAAVAGMFQDPMKLPTKTGALTAKQYLAKLDALAATGDARAAKATVAAVNQRAAKAKRTYAQNAATLAGVLAKQLQTAKRQPIAKAAETRSMLDAIERSAKSLATGAGKAGAGADLSKQLTALAADAKAARTELDKKSPPVAAKPAATKPAATKPAGRTTTATRTQTQTPAQTSPAAEPAAPVCETRNINCESGDPPCCPGERCLPAGWILSGDGYEADYYQCQDPDLAPKL